MKNQTLYRGNDNKKVKPSKTDKVFDAVQAAKRKTQASQAAAAKKQAIS